MEDNAIERLKEYLRSHKPLGGDSRLPSTFWILAYQAKDNQKLRLALETVQNINNSLVQKDLFKNFPQLSSRGKKFVEKIPKLELNDQVLSLAFLIFASFTKENQLEFSFNSFGERFDLPYPQTPKKNNILEIEDINYNAQLKEAIHEYLSTDNEILIPHIPEINFWQKDSMPFDFRKNPADQLGNFFKDGLAHFEIYPQFRLPKDQIGVNFSYNFRVQFTLNDHDDDSNTIYPNSVLYFSNLIYDEEFIVTGTINLFKALEWIAGWIIIKFGKQDTKLKKPIIPPWITCTVHENKGTLHSMFYWELDGNKFGEDDIHKFKKSIYYLTRAYYLSQESTSFFVDLFEQYLIQLTWGSTVISQIWNLERNQKEEKINKQKTERYQVIQAGIGNAFRFASQIQTHLKGIYNSQGSIKSRTYGVQKWYGNESLVNIITKS